MKNLITIFAVLALSLVSCKKEKALELTYHAAVEIDADEIDFISKEVIYKMVLQFQTLAIQDLILATYY